MIRCPLFKRDSRGRCTKALGQHMVRVFKDNKYNEYICICPGERKKGGVVGMRQLTSRDILQPSEMLRTCSEHAQRISKFDGPLEVDLDCIRRTEEQKRKKLHEHIPIRFAR